MDFMGNQLAQEQLIVSKLIEKQLVEKDVELATLKQQLDEKDAELATLQQQLVEKDAKLAQERLNSDNVAKQLFNIIELWRRKCCEALGQKFIPSNPDND